MISASNCLSQKKQSVDELNIFPVPDGDTGTNMSMTLSAAARELARLQDPTVSETADTASAALLRGARGNSGVILSLLFRGFSKGLKGKTEADGADLAAALGMGVEAAYKAVMKPTEGTILTVAREAAEKAIASSSKGSSVEAVWAVICDEAEASLARTPDLLPVLKKAGVVDAGGQGLCIILRAMQDVFNGGAIVEGEIPSQASTAGSKGVSAAGSFEADITFTYCTEFIVGRDSSCRKEPAELRAYLESIGDCVVVVDDDEIIKVHVHTNVPGTVLTEALTYGPLLKVKIENMREQHSEMAGGEAAPAEPRIAPAEKPFGAVAVCAGAGMAELFRELGADRIVTGGQTMNPSTEDILTEINRTPAETVFVLPNNKNIIMAAEQCIPLTEKRVVVIPTKTVPQGITALLSLDETATEEEISDGMAEAIAGVHTALVTYAARDSDFDGHEIHAGEYLALLDGALVGSYTNIETLLDELSWSVDELSPAVISVYYGEDVSEEDAEGAAKKLGACFPDAEVSVVNGGQPVYYYMISIE